jgi:hypothetical protein
VRHEAEEDPEREGAYEAHRREPAGAVFVGEAAWKRGSELRRSLRRKGYERHMEPTDNGSRGGGQKECEE